MIEQRSELRIDMNLAGANSCAHHWQIDTPNGETSDACCKTCGATRSFANYSPGRTMTRSVKAPATNGMRV